MIIIGDYSSYIKTTNPIKLDFNNDYKEYLSKKTFDSQKSFLKSYFLIEDSLAQMAVNVFQDDAFLILWKLSDINKLLEARSTTCCMIYYPGITVIDLLQQKIRMLEIDISDMRDKIIDINNHFTEIYNTLKDKTDK